MKQTPLILSILALVGVAALGIIMLTGDGTGKKKENTGEVVETKVQSIQEKINRRGNKLQSDVNKFQSDLDKGILVRSVAEQRNQKLQQQQTNFNNYANQKQQEIAEEQQVMMNQIADAIKTFIDKYNEEHKFAMIISTQGGILPAPVACGDPELDITDALLSGLNSEYVKNKGKETEDSANE